MKLQVININGAMHSNRLEKVARVAFSESK